MLTIQIEGEELVTSGAVETGEVYQNYCCVGFDWEVALIFDAPDPEHNSIWGVCHNPNCPQQNGDYYHGVSHNLQLEFAEKLGEMMNITKYNVFVVITKRFSNCWGEEIFSEGQILHCTNDLGNLYLAKAPNSTDTPRMLDKSNCRPLTEVEKENLLLLMEDV
jgi:hypothetical protein